MKVRSTTIASGLLAVVAYAAASLTAPEKMNLWTHKAPSWDAWQTQSIEWLTAQKLLTPVK